MVTKGINLPVNELTKIFEDKKTKAKTLAIPFVFPDYSEGIITITKRTKLAWVPGMQIESITINLKTTNEDKPTT